MASGSGSAARNASRVVQPQLDFMFSKRSQRVLHMNLFLVHHDIELVP